MSTDAYTHKHVDNGQGRPLLFLFHGTGGDENQFMELGRDLLPEAGIVSPRGDVSEHGAARFFRRAAEGVYDMDDLARATEKMAGFVRAHVEAAQPSAVLGLGYSNGANILASVMFAEPDLFDTAALMHPLIPFTPKIEGELGASILITAGQADPICPPDMTSRLDAWLREAGASVTLDWHPGGHEIRKSELDAVRNHFAAWAGDATERVT
jgi:phospholipase/carboxylesterase